MDTSVKLHYHQINAVNRIFENIVPISIQHIEKIRNENFHTGIKLTYIRHLGHPDINQILKYLFEMGRGFYAHIQFTIQNCK